MRSTQRYEAKPNRFKEKLRERVIAIASEYGRYGYRQVTNLLKMEGVGMSVKIVFIVFGDKKD